MTEKINKSLLKINIWLLFADPELLHQYQDSMKPSEPAYRAKESVEEALKTPWTPHISVSSTKENAEKTIPEAYVRRAQSAPVYRNLPTTSVILKIPQPTFQRESPHQHNDVIRHYQTSDKAVQVENQNNNPTSDTVQEPSTTCDSESSNHSNLKKSILKQRPSTAHPNLETHQKPDDFKVVLSQRPNSSMVNSRPEPKQATSKSLQDVSNKRVQFTGSVMKKYQEIVNQENAEQKPSSPTRTPTSWNDRYSVVDDRLRTDIKVVDGNWKERLINRRYGRLKRKLKLISDLNY
jgi:hypothetical protein